MPWWSNEKQGLGASVRRVEELRGSKIMSPLIHSILGLAVSAGRLLHAICNPTDSKYAPSEEATPPLSGALVNAWYRVPEPTPTPDLTTPTATPFSNTTPIPYPTESPSAEVVAYPDLPPPALPASVEAWRDAVVRVSVERASGRPRDQQGLVVADGAVLTVLDHMVGDRFAVCRGVRPGCIHR